MTEVYVKVEPGSEEFAVDCSGTYPRVELRSEASQGRANRELTTRLSELLGEKVGIVSGHRSRRKKIVVDVEREEIWQRLCGEEG